MTIYARSDLAYVFVSPEAHGGCGNPHRRPVRNGAPDRVWGLSCPPCEDHLRTSDHWSPSIAEIPETFDEKKAREDYETRGAKDRDYIQAMALAKIAGVDIPETLVRVLSGQQAHVPAAAVCAGGHENPVAAKFCAECGMPMNDPEPPAARHPSAGFAVSSGLVDDVTLPEPPVDGGEGDGPEPVTGDLGALHVQKLKKLARERGVDDSGTKDEVLTRLQDTERT